MSIFFIPRSPVCPFLFIPLFYFLNIKVNFILTFLTPPWFLFFSVCILLVISISKRKNDCHCKNYWIFQRVLDAAEYYFNLTDANAYASDSSKLSWQQLYAFKKDFGLKSLELSELDNLVNRMAQDHSLLNKYYEYVFSEEILCQKLNKYHSIL